MSYQGNVVVRPYPHGPFYEIVPTRDGYRSVPYYAEPDGDHEMTAREAAAFVASCECIEGSVVIGDTRRILPLTAAS